MAFGMDAGPEQQAEAARIAIAQDAAVVELEVVVLMLGRRKAGGGDPERARHAEMNQGVAAVGCEQKVFRAPRDAEDIGAGEPCFEAARDRLAQAAFAHDERGDPPSGNERFHAAARGFNFRQFRHGVRKWVVAEGTRRVRERVAVRCGP